MTRNRFLSVSAGACLTAAVATALYSMAAAQTSAGPSQAPAMRRMLGARNPIPPPFIMFRTLAPPQAHGRVAMAPTDRAESVRYVTDLSCARVAYAAGAGLCLVEEAADSNVKHVVYLLGRDFARGKRIELTGVPIRARVSPNGRLASITVYAEEESPAGERLAAESILIDMRSGSVLADLREFAVENTRFASMIGPIDITGVAFAADGDRFFATLSTTNERYLVAGTVVGRRMEVIGTAVANEALAPDGKRLAAKKRVGDRGFWQLIVLELATMSERVLEQGERSVDDQVEWLDDAHLIYHDAADGSTGIWVLPTDGRSGPRLLIADAYSPVVGR